MSDAPWPFDQPRDCAVITLRSIISGDRPILHVSHDADDHGWQFLDGSDEVDMADAAVVSLASVVLRDSTLLQVADIPPGWIASRTSVDSPWQRSPRPNDYMT